MNSRFVFKSLGKTMLIEAVAMLTALCVAFYYKERDVYLCFIVPIALLFLIGGLLASIRNSKKHVSPLDGFMLVSLCWISMTIFGSLPFVFSKTVPSIIDAIFETASGFTTTGASVITDLSALSMSEHYWRCLIIWIGGMGVITLLMLFTTHGGRGTLHIMRAESPGPTVDKMVPKIKDTAILLYKIYIALTVMEMALLMIFGVSIFESICLSFSTAGTGGFALTAESIAACPIAAQWIIGIFVVLFGTNFSVFFYISMRKFGKAFKYEEARVFFSMVAASTLLIFINILPMYESGITAIKDAFFQTGSLVSTTGFSTTDFNLWPSFSKMILVTLMFTGACAGSTAGGFKISRVIVLIKSIKNRILQLINPKSYRVVKLNDNVVEDAVVRQINVYFAVFMVLQLFSMLLLSLENQDLETTSTAVIACFNNIGPGLGAVGPTGSYAMFSGGGKILLTLNMLFGRLEIYPMILLLHTSLRGVTRSVKKPKVKDYSALSFPTKESESELGPR